ncbi:MAG: pyocin knob domain-containing protein [Prevotellaceae bacterium]|jgi:hypothetical protein|nr:pyocin knob domain-containing protein [Prevotellaceae bacterium]
MALVNTTGVVLKNTETIQPTANPIFAVQTNDGNGWRHLTYENIVNALRFIPLAGNTSASLITGLLYMQSGRGLQNNNKGGSIIFDNNGYAINISTQGGKILLGTYGYDIDIEPGRGLPEQYANVNLNIKTKGTGKAFYNGNEIATKDLLEQIKNSVIVETLPDVADAQPDIIYFVPVQNGEDTVLNGYLLVNGALVQVATQSFNFDLSEFGKLLVSDSDGVKEFLANKLIPKGAEELGANEFPIDIATKITPATENTPARVQLELSVVVPPLQTTDETISAVTDLNSIAESGFYNVTNTTDNSRIFLIVVPFGDAVRQIAFYADKTVTRDFDGENWGNWSQSITDKQDKTDNALTTNAREIVPAINEVNNKIATVAAEKQDKIDLSLNTPQKTVSGAINGLQDAIAAATGNDTLRFNLPPSYFTNNETSGKGYPLSLETYFSEDIHAGGLTAMNVRLMPGLTLEFRKPVDFSQITTNIVIQSDAGHLFKIDKAAQKIYIRTVDDNDIQDITETVQNTDYTQSVASFSFYNLVSNQSAYYAYLGKVISGNLSELGTDTVVAKGYFVSYLAIKVNNVENVVYNAFVKMTELYCGSVEKSNGNKKFYPGGYNQVDSGGQMVILPNGLDSNGISTGFKFEYSGYFDRVKLADPKASLPYPPAPATLFAINRNENSYSQTIVILEKLEKYTAEQIPEVYENGDFNDNTSPDAQLKRVPITIGYDPDDTTSDIVLYPIRLTSNSIWD